MEDPDHPKITEYDLNDFEDAEYDLYDLDNIKDDPSDLESWKSIRI